MFCLSKNQWISINGTGKFTAPGVITIQWKKFPLLIGEYILFYYHKYYILV